MKKITDKIEIVTKNKRIQTAGILMVVITAITVIAVSTVLIMKEYKIKPADQSISTEETKSGISIKFTYYEDYWKKYDLTNAVYKTKDEYENAVRDYIDEITILLNKQDWFEQYTGMNTLCLELHISNLNDGSIKGGISSYKESIKQSTCTYDLNLSDIIFNQNRSQLVHALADLVITKTYGVSNDIEEGLAEYIQNNLGMGLASVNYGLDIHNYLIEYTKINEKDANTKAVMGYIKGNLGKISQNRIHTYSSGSYSVSNIIDEDMLGIYKSLCNHSFIDYLVQTYGITNVMKIVEGYDESIYYLFNPNGLNGVISDWQQFLANYQCKMTWDEIDAYITALKKTHG